MAETVAETVPAWVTRLGATKLIRTILDDWDAATWEYHDPVVLGAIVDRRLNPAGGDPPASIELARSTIYRVLSWYLKPCLDCIMVLKDAGDEHQAEACELLKEAWIGKKHDERVSVLTLGRAIDEAGIDEPDVTFRLRRLLGSHGNAMYRELLSVAVTLD